MKKEELSVAVIGLRMGEYHLKSVLEYGARVSAICDSDEKLLAEVGDRFQIPVERRFTNYLPIVDDPTVNVALIVTPDQLHREMTEKLLEAGKHVMCEKPLALTREDLDAIVAATKKSTCKFMVGQICHFTPAFIKAKELLDGGVIGELYYVESEYAHDYYHIMQDLHGWRCDPKRHGVVGGGCHAVDLLRWYAGDPEEVFAYGTHKLLPMVSYDDATISVLKFPNGVVGKVFVSTGCKRNYTMRTLLYGTKGTIICDNKSDTMQLFTVEEDGVTVKKEPEIIPVEINNHNTDGEFAVFANSVINDLPVEMDALQGAITVAACLAIVESSACGMPVRPNYNF
jgi:predicted dehydrogenase